MNLYRNNHNKKLYIITHLIRDIYHLNNNGFAGIYAVPYFLNGKKINYLSRDHNKCKKFVDDNFKKVTELAYERIRILI